MAFQCVILTPETKLLDQQVSQAIIPAHDGLMGILTNRAPAMVRMGIGPMRVDLPDGTHSYFLIEGGLAQVKDNVLSVLTNIATPQAEVDGAAAAAAYSAAVARKAVTETEVQERDKDMQRARVRQAMAANRPGI